jgi:DNA-binding LacI/PurR family transcriptional regulator
LRRLLLGLRALVLLVFAVFFAGPLAWLLLAPTKSGHQLVTGSAFSVGSVHDVWLAWRQLDAFEGAQGADQGGLEARDRLRPTKGAAAAQTMLTANPTLTAIYSACGPPALGAIQSIKNAGIEPGKIILVGFDGLPDEVAAIKAGTETASVAQHPDKIGYLGIATTYAAVQGKKVAKHVDTGTSLITG